MSHIGLVAVMAVKPVEEKKTTGLHFDQNLKTLLSSWQWYDKLTH